MTSGRLPRMAEFGLTLVRHGETRYNKEKILQGQGVDEPLSETGFRQANAAGIFLSHVKFTHVFASDLLRAKQGGIDICELNEINTSDGQLPVRLRESDLPKATSRVIERGENQTGDLLNLRHLLQLHPVYSYSEVSPIEFNGTYSQTTASILGKSQFCKEIAVKYDARLRERKYGVAEGRPLSDLKTMAKAAGEQCPSFTPPGGETLDEVKARGKDFFEYLCHLVTQEARQGKQATPRTAENGTGAAEGRFSASLTNHHQGLECCSDGAAEVLDANILVVSHGAYMRNLIGYFVSDLECRLPPTLTKTELSSVSPNTGISQFTVKLENRDSIKPKICCLCLNRDDHLSGMTTEKI